MGVLGRWKLFIQTGRKVPQILRAVKKDRESYEKLAKLSARKAEQLLESCSAERKEREDKWQ